MTKILECVKINGEFRTERTSTFDIHIMGQMITNLWNGYFINFDYRDYKIMKISIWAEK